MFTSFPESQNHISSVSSFQEYYQRLIRYGRTFDDMTFRIIEQDSNNNHHHHLNKIKKTPVVATWPAIPVPRGSRTSGCCWREEKHSTFVFIKDLSSWKKEMYTRWQRISELSSIFLTELQFLSFASQLGGDCRKCFSILTWQLVFTSLLAFSILQHLQHIYRNAFQSCDNFSIPLFRHFQHLQHICMKSCYGVRYATSAVAPGSIFKTLRIDIFTRHHIFFSKKPPQQCHQDEFSKL